MYNTKTLGNQRFYNKKNKNKRFFLNIFNNYNQNASHFSNRYIIIFLYVTQDTNYN